MLHIWRLLGANAGPECRARMQTQATLTGFFEWQEQNTGGCGKVEKDVWHTQAGGGRV